MAVAADIDIIETAPVNLARLATVQGSTQTIPELFRRLIRAGVRRFSVVPGRRETAIAETIASMCDQAEDVRVAVEHDRGPVDLDGSRWPTFAMLSVGVAPTDGFARAAHGESSRQHLRRRLYQIADAREHGLAVRARIDVAFGCPYQGDIEEADIVNLAETLYLNGCSEIVLADTLGVARPHQAASLVNHVTSAIPARLTGVRFHDTYGLAMTNLHACLDTGLGCVETALGMRCAQAGPSESAPLVATEDVVNLLNGMRIGTGIDLHALVAADHFLARELGQLPGSRTADAFRAAGCRI